MFRSKVKRVQMPKIWRMKPREVMHYDRQPNCGNIGIAVLSCLVAPVEPIVVNRWLLGLMMSLGVLTFERHVGRRFATLKRTACRCCSIAAAGIVKHLQARQFCICRHHYVGSSLLGFIATCVNGTFFGPSSDLVARFTRTLLHLRRPSLALLSTPSRLSGGLSWRWLYHWGNRARVPLPHTVEDHNSRADSSVRGVFYPESTVARTVGLVLIAALFIAVAAVLWVGTDSNASDMMLTPCKWVATTIAQEAATLTGRIPIWTNVLSDVSERPLLGYGYGGFWTCQRIWEYSLSHHWQFNHAHSSYLETLLNVGVLGLALGILIVSSATWIAVRTFNQTRNAVYRFIAAVMTMALIHGFVDSNL